MEFMVIYIWLLVLLVLTIFSSIDGNTNEKNEISECSENECNVCRFCNVCCKNNNILKELEKDLEDMNDTDMISAADLKRRIKVSHDIENKQKNK